MNIKYIYCHLWITSFIHNLGIFFHLNSNILSKIGIHLVYFCSVLYAATVSLYDMAIWEIYWPVFSVLFTFSVFLIIGLKLYAQVKK